MGNRRLRLKTWWGVQGGQGCRVGYDTNVSGAAAGGQVGGSRVGLARAATCPVVLVLGACRMGALDPHPVVLVLLHAGWAMAPTCLASWAPPATTTGACRG